MNIKIKWKGRLSETNTLSTPKIPPNSVQLLEPKYNLQYYIPIITIIIFIVLCVYLKSKFVGDITLDSLGYIIGFLLIIPFSIIHELLHAVCLPSKATVEIFYSISGLSFFITTAISKKRYIVILLFPALMTGIIPLKAGDLHNGRVVSIVKCENGKIVYKPRNLGTDIFIEKIMSYISTILPNCPYFRLPKNLCFQNYSW